MSEREFTPFTPETWEEQNKDNPDFNAGEFGFHQKRFEAKAQTHAARGPIKKFWQDTNSGGPAEQLSAVDMAHEEALIENREYNALHKKIKAEPNEWKKFDYEFKQEYREWLKRLEVVVDNFKTKRDNPESQQANNIRPLVLFMGGGMMGDYGAGAADVLQKLGYAKVADAVGISAGAVYGAYFAGDQKVQKSVYFEECTTPNFINFKRPWNIMAINYLVKEISPGMPKALDQEAVMTNPTKFYVQATRKNGDSILINAKTAKSGETGESGLMAAVHGSMCVPWFYKKAVRQSMKKGGGVEVNDELVVDGAFDALPIDEVVNHPDLHPTDVLIVPNIPFGEAQATMMQKGKWWLASMSPKWLRQGSMALVIKAFRQKEELRKSFDKIKQEKGVNIAILWPPDMGINQITNDPDTLKAAMLASAKRTYEAFGEEPQPDPELRLKE